jgi:hypothetical protein
VTSATFDPRVNTKESAYGENTGKLGLTIGPCINTKESAYGENTGKLGLTIGPCINTKESAYGENIDIIRQLNYIRFYCRMLILLWKILGV